MRNTPSPGTLRKAWNAKKIMKDLRDIHEKYYPEPKGDVADFLTEDRPVTVYGQLNAIIHAENPRGWLASIAAITASTVRPWKAWTVDVLARSMWRRCESPFSRSSIRPSSSANVAV